MRGTNTTVGSSCSTSRDCTDATSYHGAAWCGPESRCRCRHHYGFGGEDCGRLTDISAMPITSGSVQLVMYCLLCGYCTFALTRVCRGGRGGFIFSTMISTWLCSVVTLLNTIRELQFLLGAEAARGHGGARRAAAAAGQSHFELHDQLSKAGSTVSLTLGLLASLNISLMWIEFVIASRQMRKVDGNVSMMRGVLLGFMGFFVGMSVLSIVIENAIDVAAGSFLQQGVNVVTTLALIVTYAVGAGRMASVYHRQTVRIESELASCRESRRPTSVYPSSTDLKPQAESARRAQGRRAGQAEEHEAEQAQLFVRRAAGCNQLRPLPYRLPRAISPAGPPPGSGRSYTARSVASAAWKLAVASAARLRPPKGEGSPDGQPPGLEGRARLIVTTARRIVGGLSTMLLAQPPSTVAVSVSLRAEASAALYAVADLASAGGGVVVLGAIARFVLRTTSRSQPVQEINRALEMHRKSSMRSLPANGDGLKVAPAPGGTRAPSSRSEGEGASEAERGMHDQVEPFVQ